MWTNPRDYVGELTEALRLLDLKTIDRIAGRLFRAYLAGRTIFCVGNGGSAAAATHLATDLSKLTARPGHPRLKAMALVDSVAAVTAAANDMAFDQVFVEQLRTFMGEGDVVIGISTSGRSANVLKAIEYANRHGGVTIGITGADGAPLQAAAGETLSIRSLSVQQIEDVTVVAAHLVCLLAREKCLADLAPSARDRDEERVPVEHLRLTVDMFPPA